MKVLLLRLEGYKRLLLRNIKSIEITPEMIHQIVIGTNGSGKSSVLRELSPLPAVAKDFIKGGSKSIELAHRLDRYRLRTTFDVGNGKHEFYINNGENLNPGGTATVQKELIKQHFDYDDQTHRILMGITKFSTMPAMLRRDVLTELSGANLDYAFTLWQQLKTRFRDQQGVVKHLNGRVAQESHKLINIEKMEEMTVEYEDVTKELTFLMGEREPNLPEEAVVKRSVAELLERFNQFSQSVQSAKLDAPEWVKSFKLRSADDIVEVTNTVRIKQSGIAAKLEKYHEEYDELKGIMDALAASNAEGVDELRRNLDKLQIERDQLVKQLNRFTDIGNHKAVDVFAKSEGIYPVIINTLSTLPINIDRTYSKVNFDEIATLASNTNRRLTEARNRQGKLEHQLSHIEKAQKTTCPKCGYVCTPGHEDVDKKDTLKRLESINDFIIKEQQALEDAETYIEEYRDYQLKFSQWERIYSTSAYLQPFLDYVMDSTLLFTAPQALLPVFEEWMRDVRTHKELEGLTAQIELYAGALEKAKASEGGEAYSTRFQRINENIETLTTQSIYTGKQLNELDLYHRQIKNIMRDYKELIACSKQINEKVELWIRTLRKKTLDEAIKDDHKQLGHLSHQLTIGHTIQNMVDDLEKSLEQVKQDLEAYKILVDEISPVDGLIAEQVKGFIGAFVDQVNLVISQIWTYDLRILPCGIGDGDLDYKFGLMVNGELAGLDVRDSDASTGQLEVIDFAFKLVYMLYRGMDDFPLYLDELGPHMDEEHRGNIMRFVHMLVESKKCSQLWLVSHFSAMHEIFNSVEYCVMDERNIAVPHVYNNHVVFG